MLLSRITLRLRSHIIWIPIGASTFLLTCSLSPINWLLIFLCLLLVKPVIAKKYHWDLLGMTTKFSLALLYLFACFVFDLCLFYRFRVSLALSVLLPKSHWFWPWIVWQLFLLAKFVLQSIWLPGFDLCFIKRISNFIWVCFWVSERFVSGRDQSALQKAFFIGPQNKFFFFYKFLCQNLIVS